MTLIIGCKTEEFGLIAGDTQLSIGDLKRRGIDKREVEIKLNRPSSNLIFGILGKWSRFIIDETQTLYLNYYDQLKNDIIESTIVDRIDYIKKFLVDHSRDIEASVIYVNRAEIGFEINNLTSTENSDLKKMAIDGLELTFNEPFYNTNINFVENRIKSFFEKHNLTNSLADSIFLTNNIIIEIISEGKILSMKNNEGITHLNVFNSVGGFVTIDILTKDKYSNNCLFRPYTEDKNVLLDKTTFPFANYIYNHAEIRYIDNLAMLIKAYISSLTNIKTELLECINKQAEFLVNENKISYDVMNELTEFINKKYSLNIIIPTYKHEENQAITLLDIVELDTLKYDYIANSIEFYKRFF